MNADLTQATSSRSFQGLVSSYSILKEEIKNHILKNNKTLSMGTTLWKKMDDISLFNDGTTDADFVAQTSGKLFLGKQ